MSYLINRKKTIAQVLFLSLLGYCGFAQAANSVNPPNIPLESGSATGTKPNLMFIFDDSGSMNFDYMGDEVGDNLCKSYGNSLSHFSRACTSYNYQSRNSGVNINDAPTNLFGLNTSSSYGADSLYFVSSLNKMYFNPNIKYVAGVNYLATSLGNQSFTSAKSDIYGSPNAAGVNLNNIQETYFCSKSSPSATDLADTNTCKRNGIGTNNPYNYATEAYPNSTYKYPVGGPWTPHYNTIVPTEYCDSSLVNCSATASYGIAAPIRWCKTSADAISTSVISGKNGNPSTNRCQKNYDSTYKYLRIGKIQRNNITSADQLANFANWYTYYRNRHTAMRTSVGLAFKGIDNTKRIGFITINPGSNGSSKFLAIKDFNDKQKEDFYNLLYTVGISGATPLREALSRVGRYYAGKTDGINANMITSSNPDPVQFSCQQNFAILSTDGYWNGNAGKDLNNNNIGNEDNDNAGYSTRSSGAFDGGTSGASGTLSDVAMYYYKTDLRPAGSKGADGVDVSENNVPISPNNLNHTQHMVTYAISLGLNGLVDYSKDYLQGRNTDFENIKLGTSGACSWTTGVCNWPAPNMSNITTSSGDAKNIDDLWHATVNGRGKYYSAQNTQDIVEGLEDALNSLIAQTASSSSASTSSPNITATENTLFYSTYRTVHWDGEVIAKDIDHTTGDISSTPKWTASAQLNNRAGATSDTRTIYTSRASSTSLIPFNWTSLNGTEKSYFNNKCAASSYLLAQCADLDTSQQSLINNGENLVNYIRGQNGYENQTNTTNPLYREREFLLGDIVDSATAYVSNSPYNWTDTDYNSFKATVSTRTPMVYVGANDGMVHAFNANNGREEWAYIPSQVLPNLYKLADKNYAVNHNFYVNGPISIMDAYISNTWKTILVGSMGQGSQGYYALDITTPTSPKLLWEICTSSTLCAQSNIDLGWTYGKPIITKRSSDNKWVVYVTSGYDNQTGTGFILELDAATGQTLRTFNTYSGSSSSPSGLSSINTFYDNFYGNNKAKAIYGGDLDGNIWKWELNGSYTPTAKKIGQTVGPTGKVQPISTRIELGLIENYPVLFIGTGQYLNFTDYNTTDVQSIYGIKDPYFFCTQGNNRENNNYWNLYCQNRIINYGNLRQHPSIKEQTSSVTGNNAVATNRNSVNWGSDIGWFYDFKAQSGERVNVEPTLVLGTLNVVTNVPATNTCNVGGNAWIYQLNFLNGNAITGQNDVIGKKHTGGFVVGQVIARLDGSGTIKNFITDAAGNVQAVGVNINNTSFSNKKTSWSEVIN